MMELIPAMDLIDGHCVRLKKGDYNEKKIYDADPLEVARQLEDCGVRRMHIVDLDGAKSSSPINLPILERVAEGTNLDIEWGGGIKTTEALKSVFSAGAQRAICGSIAVDKHELFLDWLSQFGSDHIILGADVRHANNPSTGAEGWMVSTHGWLDTSEVSVEDLISQCLPPSAPTPVTQVICTDISRDGMLSGPNFDLYRMLLARFADIRFTLSGGVASIDDIYKAKEAGLHAAIIGKAFYEGKITLEDIKKYHI